MRILIEAGSLVLVVLFGIQWIRKKADGRHVKRGRKTAVVGACVFVLVIVRGLQQTGTNSLAQTHIWVGGAFFVAFALLVYFGERAKVDRRKLVYHLVAACVASLLLVVDLTIGGVAVYARLHAKPVPPATAQTQPLRR